MNTDTSLARAFDDFSFWPKRSVVAHGEKQIPWERSRVGELREFLLSTGPSEEDSVGWEGSFGQGPLTVAREARPKTICPAYSRCASQPWQKIKALLPIPQTHPLRAERVRRRERRQTHQVHGLLRSLQFQCNVT